MAKMYFDAIAQIDAQHAISKYVPSPIDCGGVMRKTRMSAVMMNDSTFVGALKEREKKTFAAQQSIVMHAREKRSISGWTGNTPIALRISATKKRAISS